MTTPTTRDIEAFIALLEETLPAPDEQGRRGVTADQITRTKDAVEEFFQPFFESLVNKVAVELDGEERFLDEEELDAMPLGTVVRLEESLFVRCTHNWLGLRSGWSRTNDQVFYILTNENEDDSKIMVTTPR